MVERVKSGRIEYDLAEMALLGKRQLLGIFGLQQSYTLVAVGQLFFAAQWPDAYAHLDVRFFVRHSKKFIANLTGVSGDQLKFGCVPTDV